MTRRSVLVPVGLGDSARQRMRQALTAAQANFTEVYSLAGGVSGQSVTVTDSSRMNLRLALAKAQANIEELYTLLDGTAAQNVSVAPGRAGRFNLRTAFGKLDEVFTDLYALAGGDEGGALENIPGSDAFGDAPTIGVGEFTVNTSSFTAEAGEPATTGSTPGHSAWWKFVAPSNATFTASLIDSFIDTVLGVYTGSAVGSLSMVAENDDYLAAHSLVTWSGTSGTTYYIKADGYGGSGGDIHLVVSDDANYYVGRQNQSLTTLDVSTYTGLGVLLCWSNELTELDLSANAALHHLDCDLNQLTALDLSANPGLRFLDCSQNQLTALNISANPLLRTLQCASNSIVQADVDAILVALDGNGVTGGTVNLSGNTAPSATGLAAKASLQGKGWSVAVDS